MPTKAEVLDATTIKVYDSLIANFDASKWATITMPTTHAECDATFKVAVFTFDIYAFETACAAASDACTFTAADYVPYAFGI
jgi:hypothetical protein